MLRVVLFVQPIPVGEPYVIFELPEHNPEGAVVIAYVLEFKDGIPDYNKIKGWMKIEWESALRRAFPGGAE